MELWFLGKAESVHGRKSSMTSPRTRDGRVSLLSRYEFAR